jgi:hypothetical protein
MTTGRINQITILEKVLSREVLVFESKQVQSEYKDISKDRSDYHLQPTHSGQHKVYPQVAKETLIVKNVGVGWMRRGMNPLLNSTYEFLISNNIKLILIQKPETILRICSTTLMKIHWGWL